MTDEPRPFRRRILINTAAIGAGNVWAIIVSVVALPVTLHGLGTDAFGTWVLLNTFSAMTGWFSVADLGIGAATTREVAQCASTDDRAGVRRSASSGLVLFLLFGAVFSLLLALIGPAVLPSFFETPADLVSALQFAIVVFAGQVLIDQLTNAVEAALDGLQRVDLARGLDAIRRTAVSAAVAVAALAGGGLRGVALASLGGAVVGAVVAAFVLHREEQGWWRAPHRQQMRSLMSYAKAVAVLQPIGVITRQMDRLIVGAVLGPAAVTLVEIATQVQSGAYAILSAATYVANPASSWVDARDEPSLLHELVLRGTKYSLLMTYPVAVGATILAPDLVHVWVGPAFAAAAGLIALAMLDVVVTAPMQTISNVLIGVGRAPEVVKAALGAVIINLAVSLVLVHLIGTAGVFMGTLVAACFLVPALARAGFRLVDLGTIEFLRAAVWPAVVACLPMAVVAGAVELLPLRPLVTILVAGAIGGLTYVGTAAAVSLSRTERTELRSMLPGRGHGDRGPRHPGEAA